MEFNVGGSGNVHSRAQVMLLLYTIREAGGDLEKVLVKSSRGVVKATDAIKAWEKKYPLVQWDPHGEGKGGS